MTQSPSRTRSELSRILKSVDFSKAVIMGLAVTVPILLGIWMGHSKDALAISLGAFWSSSSDISGSYRHKAYGIVFSVPLIMAVSLMGGYLHYETWLPLPVLGFLSFVIAYISVYGVRASLISFSGLLALVLSFANDYCFRRPETDPGAVLKLIHPDRSFVSKFVKSLCASSVSFASGMIVPGS